MVDKVEVRAVCGEIGVEIRAKDGQESQAVIRGYAAVFNQVSEDLGGFIEVVEPSFFDGVMDDDVRALFNHDSGRILGRTRAGTLRLEVDERGLRYEVDAPESAKDVVEAIQRGDISGSSFAFSTAEDWWGNVDGQVVRRLVRASRLFDVSPVVYPAYPQTSVNMRGMDSEVIEALRVKAGEVRAEGRSQTREQGRLESDVCARTGSEEAGRQARLANRKRLLRLLERS